MECEFNLVLDVPDIDAVARKAVIGQSTSGSRRVVPIGKSFSYDRHLSHRGPPVVGTWPVIRPSMLMG
jgi:hypothetical protein